ncbi:hypothetical protein C4K03_5808 [Pseudomonas synxantha]|uniref:Uncharacterized protein n=1 Tax=Pseudomonas synxantha TaxID=47883 RepID=A0A3G7UEQ8_9PSED|nr:hypothetical protein C4K03_5808 [Pseudomonas synxantha]
MATVVALQGVKKASLLGASVGLALRRTLSMGDMAQSDPDAQAPVVGGWSP